MDKLIKEDKMKKKIFIMTLIVLSFLLWGIGGFFVYKQYFPKGTNKETKKITSKTEIKVLKLDPQKEATHLSKVMGTQGAYWLRGFPVIWNDIERKKSVFDWSSIDKRLQGKDSYFSGEVYHIAMIWPYANWDQEACHQGKKYEATGHLKESGESLKIGAPCDLQAYANFLEKVVERYDGDGNGDLPGLSVPIKYWEIMNEPEMQGGRLGGAGEELKFFVGTPQEYLEILKTSYQTIKKSDPEAKIAHAGMAGMKRSLQDFWDPIFTEAGNYFDIANIHTISTDVKREDLYVIKFKKYLKKHGIKNKPIWITEVQFGGLMDKPKDVKEFEKLLVRASVFSLAQGADKLFFIENWTMWDSPNVFRPSDSPIDLSQNTTHKVYLNLINKLNNFDKVEILKEEYVEGFEDHDGATSEVGQYKFTNGTEATYVLWGKAELPKEITGKVRITDIYGGNKNQEATDIVLSNFPIFID